MSGRAAGDDWRRVWAAVDQWREDAGWTWQRVYKATGISDATFGAMKREGQPIRRADKLNALCQGLGWSRGSIDDVLAGRSPTIVSDARATDEPTAGDLAQQLRALTDRVSQQLDEMLDRIEALERQLESQVPAGGRATR